MRWNVGVVLLGLLAMVGAWAFFLGPYSPRMLTNVSCEKTAITTTADDAQIMLDCGGTHATIDDVSVALLLTKNPGATLVCSVGYLHTAECEVHL